MSGKKYYWLKLHKDFFKRHDIRIIEEMPNGKDYILFYLKLLVESIDHEGCLRFSETVPYNEQMLSVITHTNIDIVRSAMKVFIDLKMVEIYSDETIYMNEVTALIGSESAWAEKKRATRKAQKEKQIGTTKGQQKDNVLGMSRQCPIDKEIDKDKEIEKEIELELDKEKEFICLNDKQINAIVESMNEKQREIYQNYFEIEPFIEIPTKSGCVPINQEMIIEWDKKYSNVCVCHELQEINTWLKTNGSKMNTNRTLSFIEKWLAKHQAEDKLTDSEIEELKKEKMEFKETYKCMKERRKIFFDNMNDEKWLSQF